LRPIAAVRYAQFMPARDDEQRPDAKRGSDVASDPAHANIRAIAKLESAALHARSRGERISDAIARVVGSVPFVAVHVALFAAWIVVNLGLIDRIRPFDPFPFNFLTLLVSLEAIFLSIFILISQNRITRNADRRAHLDLQVDLLAEQEMTVILQMLQAICRHLGIAVPTRSDVLGKLIQTTNIHELVRELDRKLPNE
jgi:uncharacterized membrane protein